MVGELSLFEGGSFFLSGPLTRFFVVVSVMFLDCSVGFCCENVLCGGLFLFDEGVGVSEGKNSVVFCRGFSWVGFFNSGENVFSTTGVFSLGVLEKSDF